MKKTIKLSESRLHNIIIESVKRIIKEHTKQEIDDMWREYEKLHPLPPDESMFDEVIQNDDCSFAAAYCHTNDPMYKRVKSNTLRGMMGNEDDEYRTEFEKNKGDV